MGRFFGFSPHRRRHMLHRSRWSLAKRCKRCLNRPTSTNALSLVEITKLRYRNRHRQKHEKKWKTSLLCRVRSHRRALFDFHQTCAMIEEVRAAIIASPTFSDRFNMPSFQPPNFLDPVCSLAGSGNRKFGWKCPQRLLLNFVICWAETSKFGRII